MKHGLTCSRHRTRFSYQRSRGCDIRGITNAKVGAAWPGYSEPERGSCKGEGYKHGRIVDVEPGGSMPHHLRVSITADVIY